MDAHVLDCLQSQSLKLESKESTHQRCPETSSPTIKTLKVPPPFPFKSKSPFHTPTLPCCKSRKDGLKNMHIGGGGTNESVGMIKLVGAAARDEMTCKSSFDEVEGVDEEAVTKGEAMDSGENVGILCGSDCEDFLCGVYPELSESVSGVGSWNAELDLLFGILVNAAVCGVVEADVATRATSRSFASSIDARISSIPLEVSELVKF